MVTLPIYTDRPRMFRQVLIELDRLEDRLLRVISKSIGKAPSERLAEIIPQLPAIWNEVPDTAFDKDVTKWVTISTLTRLYPRSLQLEHYVVEVSRFYIPTEGIISLPLFGAFRLSGDVKQKDLNRVCWIIRKSGREDLFSLTLIPPVETDTVVFEPKVIADVTTAIEKYQR